MVDRTVYTLSQDTLAKLREDHERLAGMVLNLRQQLAARRHDGDVQWRVLSGVTATNADWPTYPDETSDTYVVAVEKWWYVAEPGDNAIEHTDLPRTVIARTHAARYLPEGTSVLVLEVIGYRGKQYYLLDGLAGGAAVCLHSAAWRTRSDGSDDVIAESPDGPLASPHRFLAGDPAGVTAWNYEGDGWLVRRNSSPNSYLSPTIEITRTGVYEITLTAWMERSGIGWPTDLAGLAAALGVEYTDSDTDTLTARGYQDLRAVVRTRLEMTSDETTGWEPVTEVWHELTTAPLRDTTGQSALSGESTDGSIECERLIDVGEATAYADVVTTASATIAARMMADAKLRVSLNVVRTWSATAGAKLRYCTLLIRQIGNGSGGEPGTFSDACVTPTTTTTAGPTTTTTAPPTTAPPTTAPPTTAPPTTAPPTTAPPTTTTTAPGCPDITCRYEWDGVQWVLVSDCIGEVCCEGSCECCPPETAGMYYGQTSDTACAPVGTCSSPPATTPPPPPPP